ncbi:hypothetical protein [Jannaschia pohangensis]|uniref:Uncharacterized protein n=1 Tax=Jannaschia pohangensis TaxID=390807 RepID=A0A1I3GH55_9RHOB|nr:hypothetical protein [Jannaschia pohangensis]SFI22845.1 hypothetical protein SAMN04488095_0196 [Jannaschia pohangensis]
MWKSIALVLALTGPVAAQSFDEALTLWTDGEDMAAIAAFRSLAEGGDVDAQVFLGQISTNSALWPAEIAALPRRERNQLMRAPGGLSGKSWTEVAAETSPRADAIRQSALAETRGEAIVTLLEMGETRIARTVWPAFLAQGEFAAALEIARRRDAPDAISDWGPHLDSIDLATGVATVPGPESWFPFRRLGRSPDDADLRTEGANIARGPGMTHFVDFCTESCGAEDRDLCLGAIWMLSTDNPDLAVSTPVEGLLSQADYINSPRISGDLARSLDALQFRLDQTAPPRLADVVQCAWDGVLVRRQASSSASQ